MPDLKELVKRASDAIDTGLWDQSQACSLLAITEMLKDTIDRNDEIERREARFDEQDVLLGTAIERLHGLVGEFLRSAETSKADADKYRDETGEPGRKHAGDHEATVYAEVAERLQNVMREAGL